MAPTVKDNLIAAKKLIIAGEKPILAFCSATSTFDDFVTTKIEYLKHSRLVEDGNPKAIISLANFTVADVLDDMDRAIAAQDGVS